MIIFEGNISGQCLNNYNKKLRNEIIIAFTVVSIIILLIWYLIFGLSWLTLIPIIICITMYSLGLAFYKKIDGKPFKIIIDCDEKTVVCERIKAEELFSMIEDINTVYDYGEYYQLWEAGDLFVCQKDLLVQGTIEEFEKIFEGKIIRKY